MSARPAVSRELIVAAEHWDRLAVEIENASAWDRSRGIDLSAPGSSAGDHSARLYRRTAETLRREAETGEPHCSCCIRPQSSCAFARKSVTR